MKRGEDRSRQPDKQNRERIKKKKWEKKERGKSKREK